MSLDIAGNGLCGAPLRVSVSPESCLKEAAPLGHLGTSPRSSQRRRGRELASQKEVEGEGRRSPRGGRIGTRRAVPKLRVYGVEDFPSTEA